MHMKLVVKSALLCCICLLLVACGGGGSAGVSAASVSTDSANAATTGSAATSPGSGTPSSTVSTAAATGTGSAAATGSTVYVGGSSANGGTHVAQLVEVPWSTLPPGSQVIVAPGTYRGPVTITANGSTAAPIVVQAADPAHMPVVTDSIDLQGSSFIQIGGLLVQSPNYGGFVIRLGSHDLKIEGNTIENAPTGFNITTGAGLGLVISNNLIENSATNGISVGTNGSAENMNLIVGNTIRNSGHHGIELQGSYWLVQRNDVSSSGQSISGASGIHVYSASSTEDSGDNNMVRYNMSHGNADTSTSDGNGIQVDAWCDNNTVAFNLVWANDGPGINVFEAIGTKVYGNTAMGNSLDPGGTHGNLSEIVVGASAAIDRTANNKVFNNIGYATRSNVPAIYVDGRAFANPNTIGPNLEYNSAGGAAFRWGDSIMLYSGAQIDAATNANGNLVEAPAFSNAGSASTGGLALLHAPSLHGTVLSGETDIAGVAAQPGFAFFGAYFSAP